LIWIKDVGCAGLTCPRTERIGVKKGGLLLLVEDEHLVRELLEDALVEAGFDLVCASDGKRAIAELEANPGRFRAIVTDIRLPGGPDGWQIGRCARERVPRIPIVYMSGDSGHEWQSKGVPNSMMIAKPFGASQIVEAVSQLMSQTRR
jgi:DNA-binding response OmpR family regulator